MTNQKIFSVPLNPKLTEQEFYKFISFLEKYKHLIYDVYFTSRIAPFRQDAMGDVFVLEEDKIGAIETAIHIQKNLGISVSATFNNIQVPPTQQNLDLWLNNFQPLYDAGIRCVTLPHTHWMATGQVKARYPDLFVKNTILRDVRTPSEIVNLAKVGFDYINLDRDLMRDRDTLLRIKTAKEWVKTNLGKDLKISLLANEGCLGNCPMMVEHFEFNNNRQGSSPQYFNDPISRVSCPKWDYEDPAVNLKTADLPPWKEDWEEFISELGIDVFKMHGRESSTRLFETMDIIERWDNNSEVLFKWFDEYSIENNLENKPLAVWRDKIKNCKFDCWECQYCDKVYQKKSPHYSSEVVKKAVKSVLDSGIETTNIDIEGLTSPRVQTLLKNLCDSNSKYLEVGSFLGATGAAALEADVKEAYFVDNWKHDIQPARDDMILPNNTKESFISNIKKYKKNSKVFVFDCDMFSVDVSKIDKIDVFFYDGPHDEESTARAVNYFSPCFSEETILVFDDANWEGVVSGANRGIESSGKQIIYKKIILNEQETKSQWWNGVYVTVVK